ncbi:MAG: hypothetical protein PHY93_13945 [Bacteriovorax sp.]|nr:hypothetical protein [Bacteriovorax sp.]
MQIFSNRIGKIQRKALIRSIAWHFDLLFLNMYFFIVFGIAYFQKIPALVDNSILIYIPGIFLSIIIFGKMLFLRKNFLSLTAFSNLEPHKITYQILLGITGLATIATLISWCFAFKSHSDLLNISPIYGMRAITTSLHFLVPLESRIIFILIPPCLMYPYPEKKKIHIILLSLTLVLFAFSTQTKLGYLFVPSFLFYYFIINRELPWKLSLLSKTMISLFLLSFLVGGFELIALDFTRGMHLTNDKSIKLTAAGSPELGNIFLKDHDLCKGEEHTYPLYFETSNNLLIISQRVFQRAFSLSAEMVRLFPCLRESGWRPSFRGHQLFRLIGAYIPYYRYAYEAFRPKSGTQISSAVTNVAVDGYFNMGYLGVITSALITLFILLSFDLVHQSASFTPLLIYFKIYFIIVISQLSVLSGLVTILPLFMLFILDIFFSYYLKKDVVRVS